MLVTTTYVLHLSVIVRLRGLISCSSVIRTTVNMDLIQVVVVQTTKPTVLPASVRVTQVPLKMVPPMVVQTPLKGRDGQGPETPILAEPSTMQPR